jgi:hypothetical protein
VREALIRATGGNPLALTELARTGPSGRLADQLLPHAVVPLGRRLADAFECRANLLSEQQNLLALVIASEVGLSSTVVPAGRPKLCPDPHAGHLSR